jgi:hypothetical protein
MPVTQYKKVEKEFADRIGSALRRLFKSILALFNRPRLRLSARFTAMLIPHSESRVFVFQISRFTIMFVLFTLLVIIIGFFILAGYFPAERVSLSVTSHSIERQLEEAKQALKQLVTEKSEIDTVLRSDRKVVTSIYNNQIRQITQLVGSNFFWGYVSGVLSSLTVYFLTTLPRIFSKKKKKMSKVSGIEEAIRILEKEKQAAEGQIRVNR